MKYHIISFYVIEKVVSNPIIICNILGNMLLFSEKQKIQEVSITFTDQGEYLLFSRKL